MSNLAYKLLRFQLISTPWVTKINNEIILKIQALTKIAFFILLAKPLNARMDPA